MLPFIAEREPDYRMGHDLGLLPLPEDYRSRRRGERHAGAEPSLPPHGPASAYLTPLVYTVKAQ